MQKIIIMHFLIHQYLHVNLATMQKLMKSFNIRRCGGLMVSALDSRSNGPGFEPWQGHCVVFLGKTLYSHSAFLHPGV